MMVHRPRIVFYLGYVGLLLLAVAVLLLSLVATPPPQVRAAANTFTQDWCAIEAYAGVANDRTHSAWERFIRNGVWETNDSVTLCDPTKAMMYDATYRDSYHPGFDNNRVKPYDFDTNGVTGAPLSDSAFFAQRYRWALDGADQVRFGSETDSGFVTGWIVAGHGL